MNFHITRDGKQFGPYPLNSLDQMLANRNVVGSDQIRVQGADKWTTVSEYLASRSSAPPPIPSGPPPLTSVATPAQNAPDDDVLREVAAGGRFVLYQYCFSIIVMTFKRPSKIFFLRAKEDGAGHAIQFSMISLFCGWWGIPWGPIWTIASLISNASGGKDITREVLTDKYGADTANRVLTQRGTKKAPASTGMKLFRAGLIAAPVLMAALIFMLVAAAGNDSGSSQGTGGSGRVASSAFDAANSQLNVNHGTVAFGNSPKAIAIAQTFSSMMKSMREIGFTGGKPGGLSTSKHEFLTYCELRSDQCIIMVHVPELRRFTSDAKKSLGEAAWTLAQAALEKNAAANTNLTLHVGLRGIALYDRVLSGVSVTDATARNNGLRSTETGGRPQAVLESAFAKPVPASTGRPLAMPASTQ